MVSVFPATSGFSIIVSGPAAPVIPYDWKLPDTYDSTSLSTMYGILCLSMSS
jgi:hypothetical protein